MNHSTEKPWNELCVRFRTPCFGQYSDCRPQSLFYAIFLFSFHRFPLWTIGFASPRAEKKLDVFLFVLCVFLFLSWLKSVFTSSKVYKQSGGPRRRNVHLSLCGGYIVSNRINYYRDNESRRSFQVQMGAWFRQVAIDTNGLPYVQYEYYTYEWMLCGRAIWPLSQIILNSFRNIDCITANTLESSKSQYATSGIEHYIKICKCLYITMRSQLLPPTAELSASRVRLRANSGRGRSASTSRQSICIHDTYLSLIIQLVITLSLSFSAVISIRSF